MNELIHRFWLCSRPGMSSLVKQGHDHSMMTAWWLFFFTRSPWFMAWSWFDYLVFPYSYHDHSTIIMFNIFFVEKNLFVNFSLSCCHIPLHCTPVLYHKFSPPICPASKTELTIFHKGAEFFSLIAWKQLLFKQ